MPNADQIKALIKAHYDTENEKFTTITLQIAAHEAKLGHSKLADDLRKIIDNSKSNKPKLKPLNQDLNGLFIETRPIYKLPDLIIAKPIIERIQRIISEFIQKDKLFRHSLNNRRKILLTGPSGTGKTMTAGIIANELHLPLYIILMDKMVTKYMGETGAKLRQIFEIIKEQAGVYLFDEFDAIGAERSKDNDVGEMRRVLSAFLQLLENDASDSLIIAATNNLNMLDHALFRRFDDVLHYQLPTKEEKKLLFENRLGNYKGNIKMENILNSVNGLSHSEIVLACLDAIKDIVLKDKKSIDDTLLLKMLNDRNAAYIKK